MKKGWSWGMMEVKAHGEIESTFQNSSKRFPQPSPELLLVSTFPSDNQITKWINLKTAQNVSINTLNLIHEHHNN